MGLHRSERGHVVLTTDTITRLDKMFGLSTLENVMREKGIGGEKIFDAMAKCFMTGVSFASELTSDPEKAAALEKHYDRILKRMKKREEMKESGTRNENKKMAN